MVNSLLQKMIMNGKDTCPRSQESEINTVNWATDIFFFTTIREMQMK